MSKFVSLVSLLLLLTPLSAQAFPEFLSHQGKIMDSSDTPMNGVNAVTFSLYPGATGGSDLWSETMDVAFEDGYYSVFLGIDSNNPLELSFFDGSEIYLGVQVADNDEMVPRFRIAAVPYAFRALIADSVSGSVNAVGGLSVDGNPVIDDSGKWVGDFKVDGEIQISSSDTSCTSEAAGTLRWNTEETKLEVCDGTEWTAVSGAPQEPSGGESNPGSACQALLDEGNTESGNYWIDPNGDGSPYEVYCDMETDGGGWIKLFPLPDTGNVYETENNSSNSYSKCTEDQLQFIDDRTEIDSMDVRTMGDHYQDVNYQNPATGEDFTNQQISELRGVITTFSTTSLMHTLECDNDGTWDQGYTNDLWAVAEDDEEYLLTLFLNQNGTSTTYYFWHTTPDSTFTDNTPGGTTGFEMPSDEFLPVKFILPDRLHFNGDNSDGGGVIWAFERTYVLVK